MITKEELKSHIRLMQEIEELRETIKRLEIQMKSVGAMRPTGIPAGGAGVPDRIASNLAKIDSLIERYQEKLEIDLAQQARIEDEIASLPETERLLMRYRYIDGLDWVQVAAKMNYSWQWMHKMHARILRKLADNDKEASPGDY